MQILTKIAIGIGAVFLILCSSAVTIVAIWGKPRRRVNNKKDIWDESIEDV